MAAPAKSMTYMISNTDYVFQLKLLIWKRYLESTKSRWELAKVFVPAIMFFLLIVLVYSVIKGLFFDDGLEPFLVPLAFWVYVQRIVVHIAYEKNAKLQESMRMMGLNDVVYWTSYFLWDGIIIGFSLSFILTLFTVGGLFNAANFGVILGLLFVFCLSAVSFSFFLCSFFSSPQSAGQGVLGVLLGCYVLYIVFFVAQVADDLKTAQTICCFFPPLALQIGSGAFLDSYDGIPISKICGIMFADVFIYAFLAWYLSQVIPSDVGVVKPFYFLVVPSYWFPSQQKSKPDEVQVESSSSIFEAINPTVEEGEAINTKAIPIETVDENILGRPTVVVDKLHKTFGSQPPSVNNLSFKMYENQIFALLGHNGAGKTTTISMLTGLISPDISWDGERNGASVYGHSILSQMDQVRSSMGVCPQHDVLFDNLTVKEHIIFFSQLKGFSLEQAEAEATSLTELFHLDSRLDHLGTELSGGQRRKLSVAIAVCGGSKFVLLDEPTAGMDPLARRELWDLLASLRNGRTMLLTTHYMDEADVLGDRVGIMSNGAMQCMGTTQFLKSTYGAGYKLIFDKEAEMTAAQLAALTEFVQDFIPEAKYFEEDGAEDQALYSLPFTTVHKFGNFFTALEDSVAKLHISSFGLSITSLEDVFLKVGEDHTVTPTGDMAMIGIGADRVYDVNFTSQVIAMVKRKLTYALNDLTTSIPMVALPVVTAIVGSILYAQQVISPNAGTNDILTAAFYIGGYLGLPGLIAEFIVRERADKLRNVLTVMGCDFRAYWLGTFIADYLILLGITVVIWITWGAGNMENFYGGYHGLNFFITLLFNVQLLAFSYFISYAFSSPKSCISLSPIIVILLIIFPNIINLIAFKFAQSLGTSISQNVQGGVLLWGIMILSPHGALFACLLDTTQDLSGFISVFPPVGACIAFMIVESAAFLYFCYYTDAQSVVAVGCLEDPSFKPEVLDNLDVDVIDERNRTMERSKDVEDAPLRVERLRKVFPPKVAGRNPIVATQDIAFTVQPGEIFGLLGANGAGKSTTLSMLTRHYLPTAGDAFVAQHSVLKDFSKAATHMGVVTQNNSLWDRLSVEAHLKLFARLRGVPEDLLVQLVDATINQLELTPHRHKLAMRLSGGMKRKLCVAIALIGDPEVVLLDEPSAGLDPVSRRNLWSVILRTMSHRSVVLTTHSMEEAEALCKRIGIMVQGQMRVLGTKQHLKSKFGSGFELVIKLQLKTERAEQQIEDCISFMTSVFPSTIVLSDNGGMLTFQIPKEEMSMGRAFTAVEANKERLCIEDYSLAQPTLEQVFIRTVNKHTPAPKNGNRPKLLSQGSVDAPHGMGVKYESERLTLGDPDEEEETFAGVVFHPKNYCGCTDPCVKILIGVTTVLFFAFFGGAFGFGTAGQYGAAAAFQVLSILILITCCTGMVLLNCPACKPPSDED